MENSEGERADSVAVVAAVIRRARRYLVALRPMEKRHGGLWEFPGGKVLEGETVTEALARELGEELGVRVTTVGRELFRAQDPGSVYSIRFLEVTTEGEPRALEHTALAWCGPEELRGLSFAPADLRFVQEALARPSR